MMGLGAELNNQPYHSIGQKISQSTSIAQLMRLMDVAMLHNAGEKSASDGEVVLMGNLAARVGDLSTSISFGPAATIPTLVNSSSQCQIFLKNVGKVNWIKYPN